jgi:hypothetical protein
MGKYLQLSRSYFDDKDMSDILSNGVFNQRFLLSFARSRGIFIGHKENRDNIIKYISRWGYSWRELLSIADRINSDDHEERQSTRRVEGVDSTEQVEQVIKQIQDDRGSRLKEVYTVRKCDDYTFEIQVTHIDIDPSKQKAFQRRQVTSKFEIQKVGDRIDVRHNQNDKCKEIASQLIASLKKLANKDLKTTTIELTGIRDHVKRTAFFLALTNKVKDFRHIDVLDLKVSNRFPDVDKKEDNGEASEDDKEHQETQEEAEIKSMVKHAALSGQGLLTSDLYKKLRETGYFITNVAWSAREVNGEARLVEFIAGFGKPVEATDFYYDVKKIYPRDDPKDREQTQAELFGKERPRLRRLLEAAAYDSLEEVQKPDKALKQE